MCESLLIDCEVEGYTNIDIWKYIAEINITILRGKCSETICKHLLQRPSMDNGSPTATKGWNFYKLISW